MLSFSRHIRLNGRRMTFDQKHLRPNYSANGSVRPQHLGLVIPYIINIRKFCGGFHNGGEGCIHA